MVIAIKNRPKFHIFFFIFLSSYLFILTPVIFIHKLLAAIICLGVLFHIKKIKIVFHCWYEIVIFFAVNVYLTMAVFGYDLFLKNIYYKRPLNLIIFGFGFIWTCYILQSILDLFKFLGNIIMRICSPSAGGYWKKWVILFAITFSLFSIWLIAFNPIIMSPDSWDYLGNYFQIGRSIIYSLINKYIIKIAPTNPAIAWIGIVQITFFSSLLSTILMYFHRKWIRFKWIIVLSVILPLVPSLGLHSIVVWADLEVALTILWLTYALVRVIDEIILNAEVKKWQRISLSIQVCLALVLLYYAKANTAVVYLFVVPILSSLFIIKKQWMLFASVAFSVLLVLIIRFPGHVAINASRYISLDAHKYYAGIHDMQATYYNGGNFSEKSLKSLKRYIPNIDEIKDNFTPDLVRRDLWGNLQEVQEKLTTKEFISMYADTFLRNPWQMTLSMMFRCRAYWVIDPKEEISFINYTAIYDPSTGSYSTQAPEVNAYRHSNFLTSIMNAYILKLNHNIPATFIWRFGVWSALILISITTQAIRKNFIWTIPFFPILSYIITIFLTSGWTDYRYGLPVFLVGMFLPPALLLLNFSFKTEEKLI